MGRLVCLHDNPLNGQEFEPLVPLLRQQGFEPIIHKRPIRGSKLEPLLQSIKATTKVSGGGPFAILAYSWGAYLALKYLQSYPENVTGVLLVNPLLEPLEWENRPGKGLLATPLVRSVVLRWRAKSLADKFLKRAFSPALPSGSQNATSFLSQALVWRGETAYHELMKEKPLADDFAGVKVPLRVVLGSHDQVTLGSQLDILKKFPHLHTLTITEAGHALPWTHPEVVVEELAKLV